MMISHYSLQSGVALLLVLLTLSLSAGSFALLQKVTDGTTATTPVENKARTKKLLQAKQALLAYAVAYADNYLPAGAGPGHLPCPDRSPIDDNNEGNDGPDPPCSGEGKNVGRFPRFTYSRDQTDHNRALKRIEFYSERSLQDQQMWYVVSRSHINNPLSTLVNPSTRGQLEIDSTEDIVAIIIEPGRDLSVTNPLRPGDSIDAYLEGENADNDQKFSQLDPQDGNDLLTYITASELMNHTRSRVVVFVKRWLDEYRLRHCDTVNKVCYPAAANDQGVCQEGLNEGYLSLLSGTCNHVLTNAGILDGVDYQRHWFFRNGWVKYFRYSRHPQCVDDKLLECDTSVEFQQTQGVVLIAINPKKSEVSNKYLNKYMDSWRRV